MTAALLVLENRFAGEDGATPYVPEATEADITATCLIKCLSHKDKDVQYRAHSW